MSFVRCPNAPGTDGAPDESSVRRHEARRPTTSARARRAFCVCTTALRLPSATAISARRR